MNKYILKFLICLSLLVVPIYVFSATIQGFQGGTGISTSTSGNNTKCLTQSSSTPFLTWTIGTCGGSPTSTINGFNGIIFDLIGDNIGITSTVVNGSTTFKLINPGFLTSSTGVTSFNSQMGAVNGVSSLNLIYGDLSLAVRASGTVPTFEGGGAPFYINFPIAGSQFYAPSTTIPAIFVSTYNGASGAVLGLTSTTPFFANGFLYMNGGSLSASNTIAFLSTGGISSTQAIIASSTIYRLYDASGNKYSTSTAGASVATTTLNGFTGTIFDILAGSGLSRSVVNGSTTFYGVSTSTAQLWLGIQQFVGTVSSTQLRSASSTLNGSTTLPSLLGVILATNGLGQIVATTTSGGAGTPSNPTTGVQYNTGGAFDATSTFTFDAPNQRLTLGAVTSSLFIGSNADFATSSIPGNTTTTQTFTFTGASSTFVVPVGVTAITISAVGGGITTSTGNYGGSASGAATGTLSVVAGTTYYYGVGGTATGTASTTGGFGGGGNANVNTGNSGTGGGGMTWFGTSGNISSSSLILVGAGAGGSAYTNKVGGSGGGLTGGTGGGTGNPGTGGSQTAGGTLGDAIGDCGGAGFATGGSFGKGGLGGQAKGGVENGGGGGGGGWQGGGGGGCGSGSSDGNGGGGGASFASSSLTSTSTATGGGGSANGNLTITYQAATGTVFSTSTAALYVGGHIFTGNQNMATSSVSSCGTSPSVAGNDTAGIVTVGSGVITSCTVTFGSQFANPPACVANDNSSISVVRPLTTTSTLVLSVISTFAGDKISYICFDY